MIAKAKYPMTCFLLRKGMNLPSMSETAFPQTAGGAAYGNVATDEV